MSSTRDHYFPNTEPLAANEMRIIALGTGRPFVRRAQANCSWLIELGSGDKFIMDFGAGSQNNFTSLEIPHQDITAYFAVYPPWSGFRDDEDYCRARPPCLFPSRCP